MTREASRSGRGRTAYQPGDLVTYQGVSMPRFLGETFAVHGTDEKGRVYLTPARDGLPIISTERPEATLRPVSTEGEDAA